MGLPKPLRRKREVDDIMVAFELHSAEGIRAALDAGVDPQALIRGKSPVSSVAFCLSCIEQVDIYNNITRLVAAAGRAVPPLVNVPNRYLNP
jgi:hypothetical protein